jgi:hypothetical protein
MEYAIDGIFCQANIERLLHARERRAGNTHTARGGAAGPLDSYRLARAILAVVPDALLH